MAGDMEALGETLTRHYRLSCELFSTFPQPHFTLQLSRGYLELHLDSLDLDHLEALCHTLKNKVSPSHLRIYVPIDKEVSSKVVERAVEGAGVCAVASLTLISLALHGLKLCGRTLKLLCEGVRKARTLKALHMRKCDLGDSGAENVCQAIKNVPSITHLSLVDCGLAERGAIATACLIKHQRLNRDSAMWQDTLRQRHPYLDGMKGLRRLTLNNNPALGDEGAAAIAEVLTEDLWMKAVDLQHCGFGAEAGASLCALLRANQTLEVVDVHNNPFLPDALLGELMGLLKGRQMEATAEYSWLKASQVEDEAMKEHQKGGRTAGYRASGRAIKGRRARQTRVHTSSRRPKIPSQVGVPWRVEHRLYERREGLAPGSMVKEHLRVEPQSVRTAPQPSTESASEGEVTVMKMRKKLQHYKKKYQKEREQRRKLERKLSRIQTQLKGLHTLDEATITHIEECFVKFQVFLSMMQNSGEHMQSSSSSSAATPLPHPRESDNTQITPGSFFPYPHLTIPVPVLIQQAHEEPSSSSQTLLPPPSASMQESHHVLREVVDASELSYRNKKAVMMLNAATKERSPECQGNFLHGSKSERSKEGSSDIKAVTSQWHSNDLSGSPYHSALNGKQSSGEEIVKQGYAVEEMVGRVKNTNEKKEGMNGNSEKYDSVPVYSPSRSVKQKQTVGTQVTDDIIERGIAELKTTEARSPANTDTFAMRVEMEELNELLKTGKTDYANNKDRNSMKQTRIQEGKSKIMQELNLEKDQKLKNLQAIESPEEAYQPTTSSELEGNQTPQNRQSESQSHQSIQSFKASQSQRSKSQASQALENSQSSQTVQSRQGNQSLQGSQPYLSQPLSEEIQIAPDSLSPPRNSPQLVQAYQEDYSLSSESVHSQSPNSQSPSSQPPQESFSPKTNKLCHKQSPRKPQPSLPNVTHSSQENSHAPYGKSPKKQSPKKNRSPREKLGGEALVSDVSETDDEKMRNLNAWLHGRMRGRASTPSSASSVSISEQLQQSHSSWTKGEGQHSHKGGGRGGEKSPSGREVEVVQGESEFEFDVSDLEDLSITGITLTNTSVPEDLYTPRKEDF